MCQTFSKYLKSWAPAEIFPEGGKITDILKSRHAFGAPYKKSTIFRRAVQKIDHFSARRRRKRNFCVFSRRFRLKYRVFSASAEGSRENLRVFCRTAAYDVIFSNSRGGQVPPLRAPMLGSSAEQGKPFMTAVVCCGDACLTFAR